MNEHETDNVVAREVAAHPGIDGSYHHYGHLDWVSPKSLYDDAYARPLCPVSELASADEPAACGMIADRITDDEGRISGAWVCPLHGSFRVFEYPRTNRPAAKQATLTTQTTG